MRARRLMSVACLLFVCTSALLAFPPREKALWIKVMEKGDHKTTIAVTEAIVRHVLESDNPEKHFAMDGEENPITREMLRSVLDGEEESVKVRDDDGTEIELTMSDLDVPGDKGSRGKLVLETYKDGSRTFRMSLPEIEIEACDDEDDGSGFIEMNIGWKGLLPFLAEEGGAIYIESDEDETEVWVYVQ